MGPDNSKLLLLLLNTVIVRIKTHKEKVGYSLTLVAQTMMVALAKLTHYLKNKYDNMRKQKMTILSSLVIQS